MPDYIDRLMQISKDVGEVKEMVCLEMCSRAAQIDEEERNMYLQGLRKLYDLHDNVTEGLEQLLPCG